MIYIESGSTDPYFNFGLEYYLITEKMFDEPVFLFWQTTPTLMVGKFQNTLEEINLSYAKQHHLNIVRRMSGGGTIYTDMGGWQFTFIIPGKTQEISFGEYISPVIEALHNMGIAGASFNGRNDLVIDNKKFSGNAQYLYNGFTLHHGSLLFDTNIEQMVQSTTVDPYKIISKGIKSVRERVTNISEHLPHPITPKEFKTQMIESIMGGAGYKTYILNDADRVRIEELAISKFKNWDCIYGRNPKCNITKTGHFVGGKLEINLEVTHGIICDCAIHGDFFGSLNHEELSKSLIGVKYEKEAIADAIAPFDIEHTLYQITPEEFLSCICP
ncbi:lipoate--protein ligase [Roseburia hominis]|uniref:lipoate--protein ligase n=1 Tax=Roseburia hominis TaxID=301301 RepID=UPI001F45763B|nr:lipoate--protein ligase [Roseburia hominis]